MNYRGQGAIEYLLMIGAAILVVAVVIIGLSGLLGSGSESTKDDPSNLKIYSDTVCTLSVNIWNNPQISPIQLIC